MYKKIIIRIIVLEKEKNYIFEVLPIKKRRKNNDLT